MQKRDNRLFEDYSICRTYDKVRSGEYKNFSPHFFGSHDRYKKITVLVRYYVEDILGLTAEEAIENITVEMLEEAKLKCLLKYVQKDKPVEYEGAKNYIAHLIYFAYPELPKPKSEEMVINCYKEVLEGTRKTFPKNYFKSYHGEKRAKLCFEYLWKEELKIELKDLPTVFLQSNEKGLDILKQYKLKILTQMLYYSVSDMINNMYPELSLESITYRK